MDKTGIGPSGLWLRACPAVALTMAAGLFGAGCGSAAQVTSAWRMKGVTIDSAERNWRSQVTELKGSRVFIWMQNDARFFYIRILAPEEQFRRQIAGPGMTVWFEPGGGGKLGVFYPMGTGMRDLEIMGNDNNDRTLYSPLEVPGIKVRLSSSEGSSVYELCIPLQATKDLPYAVGALPGSTLRIEVKTEKELVSRPERGGMGEGGEGGRYPGGGPGGGAFGGDREGRGGVEPYDQIDFRADVHLAAAPAAGMR